MKLKTLTIRKSINKSWILCPNGSRVPHFKLITWFLFLLNMIPFGFIHGQTVEQKIKNAYSVFEKDPQLKYAISSLYVVDANSGKIVFDKNSKIGLAPASTQKIITSATAYELLGQSFQYKTNFYLTNEVNPALIVEGAGDPTFGSWRWEATKEHNTLSRIIQAIKNQKKIIQPFISFYSKGWDHENIPDGWIWQDIGNYYGAGPSDLNWRENQFDILLKSGDDIGDHVVAIGTIPPTFTRKINTHAVAAAKGTGDNAYIYYNINDRSSLIVRGTIPVSEQKFIISGAMPDPKAEFMVQLMDSLNLSASEINNTSQTPTLQGLIKFHVEISPPLDSIIYWFNQRSINLYGEALVKTFAYNRYKIGMTDSGVSVIKDFWKSKKIDENELNISDGSGLSPQNRVTTHAQVEILKFARSRPWYSSFYHSLPVYNKMKLKSGTINKVKAFAGYHKSATGKEYIISFIVNNYNGSASALVNKMYKVLDTLK